MRVFVIFFALGVAGLQQLAELPESYCLGLGFALGVFALAWRWVSQSRQILSLVLAGFALGFAWAGAMAHARMADALPAANEGVDTIMTGVVAGLPQTTERGVRFEFNVESASRATPAHISLTWNRNLHHELVTPRAGERWRFTVRLNRPHGN